MEVKTHSTHSALVFDATHTSVATFSAFIYSVGSGFGLLAFFSSSPPLFYLSEEKGKETGLEEQERRTEVVHFQSNWNKNFVLQITSKQMFLS